MDFSIEDMKAALTVSGTGLWRLESEPKKPIRFYADHQANQIFGVDDDLEPEERYKIFMSRVYEEDMPIFMNYHRNLRDEQSEVVYRYVHPQKGIIYVRCGGKKDSSVKEFDCYRGFHQTINDTVRIEQENKRQLTELAELHQKTSYTLMEHFADRAMYINFNKANYRWLDEEGDFQSFDKYAEEMKEISVTVPEACREEFLKQTDIDNIKEQFREKDNFSFSTDVYLSGDSVPRRKTLWYYPVDDKHERILVVSKDTTEEFRKERELAEALLLANSANEAKTRFLNNMSHDIRTPMNAIIGFCNLAKKNLDNKDKCQEYLDKISTSSEHLLSLINDVLDMNRIESGKVQLIEEECQLSGIIDDIDTIMRTEAMERKIHFSVKQNIKDDRVICDSLRIKQILLNCASNALKFTKKDGKVKISVSQRDNAPKGYGCYRFEISDTGIGMSEEFIKKIYDPFSRDERTYVHQIQGTGLGMAITKNLVDMMNGSIDIDSKLGKGTKFIITLVLKLEKNNKAIGNEKDETVEFDMTGKRLLLVEDNMLNREIAVELLEEAGMIVETAENGEIALNMVKHSTPYYYDAVLMDIQMPVMNGYEATRAIRKLDRVDTDNMVIIAMTANAFDEDRIKAIEAGMNEHVAKPVDVKILMNVLGKCVCSNSR